jgi:hypothetical protein
VALPNRSQAEAIAARAAKFTLSLVALIVAILAGCGSDGGGNGTTPTGTAAAGNSTNETGEPAPDLSKSRPSRRDAEVQRNLERHLRQEAVVVAGGWTFADVEDVQVRGTQVTVETSLPPRRRDAAASLCLTARRFFLQGGQGQTAFDVVVAGRARATLGRC